VSSLGDKYVRSRPPCHVTERQPIASGVRHSHLPHSLLSSSVGKMKSERQSDCESKAHSTALLEWPAQYVEQSPPARPSVCLSQQMPLQPANFAGRRYRSIAARRTAARRAAGECGPCHVHGRPYIGANGVSRPPGKIDEKFKSENMQKRAVFYVYVIF